MITMKMILEQQTPSDSWVGEIPKRCDICGRKLIGTFIDGATLKGVWGIMCTGCFITNGVGLGTGKGQLYNILGEKLK